MSAAREEILGRVRSALADRRGSPPVEIPRGYRMTSPLAPGEIVERFAERVADYRATVRRPVAGAGPAAGHGADAGAPAGRGAGSVVGAVAEAFAEYGALRLLAAPGVPDAWRPDGLELPVDDGTATAHDLDALDGVLTGAALAIAETGTIVLDGGPRSGRRALTLVCDLHVCVVEAAQIVATVPEAIASLEPAAQAGRPITFVSGPSATSDIELQRVEGVHGPRRLEVVIAP